MARNHVNMDQDKRSEAIHDLELKHQENMHQSNVIVKEEDTRRHRLRSVVLRDENATLREQLSQKDARIKKLAQECDGMRDQLEAINQTCQEQQKQLRVQARDSSNLKSELQSLSGVTSDSAKLLSEKLALSRELAVLKPEIEHLKSQLSHQNDVLAEKLALERQLNTVEVELANEKRTNQKTLQRQASKDNEIEEDLRQQVADLEKKLAKEQRATEKAKQNQASDESEIEQELRQQVADLEKKLATAKKAKQSQETTDDLASEALRKRVATLEKELAQQKTELAQLRKTSAKELADAQNEQEILQQRLEEFKIKLRQTRAELKEARSGPSKPQNTTTTIPTVFAEEDSIKKPTAKAQARRKRRAEEISVDEFVLNTPTNTDSRLKRPMKKRGGLEHTLVGEKSAFSITPFLNKTVNITEVISEEPESPEVSNDSNPPSLEEDKTGSELTESEPSAEVVPKPVTKLNLKPTAEPAEKKARGRPPKAKALAEASPSKKNMPPPSSRKNFQVEATMTKVGDVVEDSGKENRPTQVVTAAKKGLELKVKAGEVRTSGASASGSEPEPKKKKRKLLGGPNKPTLFDEDDAEAAAPPVKRPAKMQLNVARGMGRVPLGVARSGAFGGNSLILMLSSLSRTSCRRAVDGTLTRAATHIKDYAWPILPAPRSQWPQQVEVRYASSNSRWKQRQGKDVFAREAKVQGLKSRAAFKLLEMDAKYRLFKKGQTVVDLGYAPGSWSQVAVERTKPSGRVVGIDILPAQPPKGVATIQGNFLSPGVQALVKHFLAEQAARRPSRTVAAPALEPGSDAEGAAATVPEGEEAEGNLVADRPSYIDLEREASHEGAAPGSEEDSRRLVDIVISDMSEPWPQTAGFSSNTLSNPYIRMMNTSGIAFKDHAGSMDLCEAALQFASDTLRSGGHFLCKFYQGAEDKLLESKLKKMFAKVHREKPESSRSESKEAYFVALRRKANVVLEDIQEQ